MRVEREERERERESRREKRASVSFEVKVEFFFFFGPGLAKEPSGKCTCSFLSLFLPLRRSPPRPPLRELRKHRRPRRRRLTRRTKNLSQRKRKKKRQRRRWDREKRHGARRRSSSSRKEELAREERPRRASRRGSAEKRGAPRRRRGGRCRCRRRAGGRLLRGASQGLIESWRRSSKKGERSEVVVSRSHPIELFVVETSLSLRKRVTDNQPLPSLLLSLSLFAFQNTSKPVPLSRNHEPRSLSRGSAQLSRRRLGDSLIVRNELNKWCVPGRVAIAGRAGLPEREPGCFVWSTTESSFFLLLIFSRSL